MRAATMTIEANKVAKNTFLLLAISLIPTALGSYLGSAIGVLQFATQHPIIYFVSAIAAMIILMLMIYAERDSSAGIFWLLLFTGLMGVILSTSIDQVTALKHGSRIISMAASSTAAICVGSALVAYFSSYDFTKLSSILYTALIGVIVISLLNVAFFHLSGLALAISIFSVVLFTVFLIMDVQKVINGGETNYILATLEIYLDIINIFASLLQIFAAFDGDD